MAIRVTLTPAQADEIVLALRGQLEAEHIYHDLRRAAVIDRALCALSAAMRETTTRP